MLSSKHKSRHIEYLPQLSNDFSFNKSHFKQGGETPTPKSTKNKRNYSFNHRYNDKQTSELNLINSKGMEYLKRYRKSSNQGTYEYESINESTYSSGKNSNLKAYNSERHREQRNESKNQVETFQLYDSIESNLTECDKILLKLKNISLKTKQHPYVKKNSLQEYYQTQQSLQSKQKDKEKSEGYYRNNEEEYGSKYNTFQITQHNGEYLTTSSDHTTPYTKVHSAHEMDKLSSSMFEKRDKEREKQKQRDKDHQPVGSQKLESVIELRRQRINEIIQNRRSSTENTLEGNFVRMKARGEKMFSKMVGTRERSIDNGYLQEQQY